MDSSIFFVSFLVSPFVFILAWKIFKEFRKKIELLTMKFEDMDKYFHQKVLQFGIFHLKFALVNDPVMIHKVLSSELCLEKPRLIYKLLGTKYSLVSEPCKLQINKIQTQLTSFSKTSNGVTIEDI